MKHLILLAPFILVGCAYAPQVTYQTSPIGASLYEIGTGNYLGSTPLVVTYYPNSQHYKDGCYIIKGVTASWASGAKNEHFSTYKLCNFNKHYNINIPYTGDESKIAYDLKIESLMVNALNEKNQAIARQQRQGISEGEAIVWSSLITGASTLAGVYVNPAVTYQTARTISQPNTAYQAPQQSQLLQPVASQPILLSSSPAGGRCNADMDCKTGLKCEKPPLNSYGICMQVVNEYGTPMPFTSNPNSVLPNLDSTGKCTLSSDCPIDFLCDSSLKACVK
jgi:hypothetical protein